jgi:hypothetical protein
MQTPITGAFDFTLNSNSLTSRSSTGVKQISKTMSGDFLEELNVCFFGFKILIGMLLKSYSGKSLIMKSIQMKERNGYT